MVGRISTGICGKGKYTAWIEREKVVIGESTENESDVLECLK